MDSSKMSKICARSTAASQKSVLGSEQSQPCLGPVSVVLECFSSKIFRAVGCRWWQLACASDPARVNPTHLVWEDPCNRNEVRSCFSDLSARARNAGFSSLLSDLPGVPALETNTLEGATCVRRSVQSFWCCCDPCQEYAQGSASPAG